MFSRPKIETFVCETFNPNVKIEELHHLYPTYPASAMQ